MANMFNAQSKKMAGGVVVHTRKSNMIIGANIQHVVQNTADDATVLNEMSCHTDIVKLGDMTAVMSAFVLSVKEIMSRGNAVRVSGLGTFYLTAKEKEDGSSDFSVAFRADKSLKEAAKMAKADASMPSDSAPQIESIQCLDSEAEHSEVKAEDIVVLKGKRMRAAGNTNETGIFMVPCDRAGNYKKDKSDWVRVDDKFIVRNFLTEIIFKVPKVYGRHRVAIVTKSLLNGSKNKLLKRKREGVSVPVTVK